MEPEQTLMITPIGGLFRDSNDCLQRHCIRKRKFGAKYSAAKFVADLSAVHARHISGTRDRRSNESIAC